MPVVIRLIELMTYEFCRHELQIRKMTRIIMGIFISVSISKLFHKLRRGIPKIKRH